MAKIRVFLENFDPLILLIVLMAKLRKQGFAV